MSDTNEMLSVLQRRRLPAELWISILDQCTIRDEGGYMTFEWKPSDKQPTGPPILATLLLSKGINDEVTKGIENRATVRLKTDIIPPQYILRHFKRYKCKKIYLSHYTAMAYVIWRPGWGGEEFDAEWNDLGLHPFFLREGLRVCDRDPRDTMPLSRSRKDHIINGRIECGLWVAIGMLHEQMPTLQLLDLGMDVLELIPCGEGMTSFRLAVEAFLDTAPENYDLDHLPACIKGPFSYLSSHANYNKLTICIVWKQFLEDRYRRTGFAFNPELTNELRGLLQAKAMLILKRFYSTKQYNSEVEEVRRAAEAVDPWGKAKAKKEDLAAFDTVNPLHPIFNFPMAITDRQANDADEFPEYKVTAQAGESAGEAAL